MSLFNRPAWAKQQLSNDADADRPEKSIFSHSHSYQDIVAEQEKRKKEKAERKKAKAERRSSGKREVKEEPIGESTPKRRRITGEESEKLLSSVGLPARIDLSDNDEPEVQGTPVRRSLRKQRQEQSGEAARPARPAAVIDFGNSSEEDNHDDLQTSPGASRRQAVAPAQEIQDDSEDEFAELARRARQQRQLNNRSSHTPNLGVTSPSPGASASNISHDRPPDPVIQLLITSSLPGTNPLIVHRKLSQSIGPIRQAWCQKQAFSKEYTETVFFAHRMRRVYDVTTCRSLGLEADESGRVTMRGAEGREGVEKVLLEAVTEDLFNQMKEQKMKAAQSTTDLPANGADEEAEAPAEEESVIRVTLKAKGQNDFKLKVKPSTEIRKIAAAYARSVLKNPERQVRLDFDGDDLNLDEYVRDTEIEDMNVIDVHMV